MNNKTVIIIKLNVKRLELTYVIEWYELNKI